MDGRRGGVLGRFGGALALLLVMSSGCAAVAYAAAGEPDPSFGSGGIATYPLGFGEYRPGSSLSAVTLAPGGDIDVAGESNNGGGDFKALAARLSESGALDTSFGSDGAATTSPSPQPGLLVDDYANTELVQEDGSLVLAGDSLGRLTPAGQLDSSFSTERPLIEVEGLAALPSGDLLAIGGKNPQENSPQPAAVERLLPNGARDVSFGEESVSALPLHAGKDVHEIADAVIVLTGEKLLLAGSGSYYDSAEEGKSFLWLAQLDSDGSLDSSFGAGGIDYIETGSGPAALVQESGGRIVVCGTTTISAPGLTPEGIGHRMAAWGFTANGLADPSFGSDGMSVIPSAGEADSSFLVAASSDSQGRLFVAGDQEGPERASAPPIVVRLSSAGVPDASYGRGGVALGPDGGRFFALTVDSAGRAIAAGGLDGDILVERFLGGEGAGGSAAAAQTAQTSAPAPAGAGSKPSSSASEDAGGGGGAPKLRRVGLRSRAGSIVASLTLSCVRAVASARRAGSAEVCSIDLHSIRGLWSKLQLQIARGRHLLAATTLHVTGHGALGALKLAQPLARGSYRLTIVLQRARHNERASASVSVR